MLGVRDQSNGRADVADLTDIQLNWAGTFTGVPVTPTNASTGSDANAPTTGANDAPGGGAAPDSASVGAGPAADQAASGGGPAGNDAPLKATDTDIFFGKTPPISPRTTRHRSTLTRRLTPTRNPPAM